MILRRTPKFNLLVGRGISYSFCDRSDKIRKMEEKLREEERKAIKEEIEKSDPSFSTIGTTYKAGRGKYSIVKYLILGGVIVFMVLDSLELRQNPVTFEKRLVLKQEVRTVYSIEARWVVSGLRRLGFDGTASNTPRLTKPEYRDNRGELKRKCSKAITTVE